MNADHSIKWQSKTVSYYLRSTFIDSINIFNCCLSGVFIEYTEYFIVLAGTTDGTKEHEEKESAESTEQKKPDLVLTYYNIPINDTTLELSVFWPSDTESLIKELRFSESISLSFKTRLTSVTCFCSDVT